MKYNLNVKLKLSYSFVNGNENCKLKMWAECESGVKMNRTVITTWIMPLMIKKNELINCSVPNTSNNHTQFKQHFKNKNKLN